MNYEEAMNFIQNTSKFGSVLGLDNIKELLERLGNPQDQLKVVHIAGTNGKGSTLAFLAGIFRESGYPQLGQLMASLLILLPHSGQLIIAITYLPRQTTLLERQMAPLTHSHLFQ